MHRLVATVQDSYRRVRVCCVGPMVALAAELVDNGPSWANPSLHVDLGSGLVQLAGVATHRRACTLKPGTWRNWLFCDVPLLVLVVGDGRGSVGAPETCSTWWVKGGSCTPGPAPTRHLCAARCAWEARPTPLDRRRPGLRNLPLAQAAALELDVEDLLGNT